MTNVLSTYVSKNVAAGVPQAVAVHPRRLTFVFLEMDSQGPILLYREEKQARSGKGKTPQKNKKKEVKIFVVLSYLKGVAYCSGSSWMCELKHNGKCPLFRFTHLESNTVGEWKELGTTALKTAWTHPTCGPWDKRYDGKAMSGAFSDAGQAIIVAACQDQLKSRPDLSQRMNMTVKISSRYMGILPPGFTLPEPAVKGRKVRKETNVMQLIQNPIEIQHTEEPEQYLASTFGTTIDEVIAALDDHFHLNVDSDPFRVEDDALLGVFFLTPDLFEE